VARLKPLSKLGEDGGSLGIYVGNQPSFEKEAKAKTVADKVLGFDVQWQLGESEGWKSADALLRFPPQGKGRGDMAPMVHLFASAPDDAGLERLRALARMLTIEKR